MDNWENKLYHGNRLDVNLIIIFIDFLVF